MDVILKCESDDRSYDQSFHAVRVRLEDEQAWHGRPISNPACPELTYPKYAWKAVS